MKLALMFVLPATPASAYWHTAKICLKIAHAETAVMRSCSKLGYEIKHGVKKILHKDK